MAATRTTNRLPCSFQQDPPTRSVTQAAFLNRQLLGSSLYAAAAGSTATAVEPAADLAAACKIFADLAGLSHTATGTIAAGTAAAVLAAA